MAQEYRNPKPKKSDAYIVDVAGEWRVRPPAAIVRKPDGFDICNLTTTTFVVDLSAAGGGPPFPLKPGEWKSVPLTTERGAFEYSVTLESDPKRKARGDSDPVIIIDPPGN
jgi:hypothetical protein